MCSNIGRINWDLSLLAAALALDICKLARKRAVSVRTAEQQAAVEGGDERRGRVAHRHTDFHGDEDEPLWHLKIFH
ncbi:hypothetical protein C8034_v005744 [Colletotrichum sidae]|uniref:Secreted protein n=1 Tax=Colletotrichum sidae TaxID=1347389 RepID=A0A4R8T617_9PEZI|nr:hypothetical protein C8034_v005744 [Colletotrichum sidae]